MSYRVISLLLLLFPAVAGAATYYLNSTVGAGGNGSQGSPYDAFADITIAANDTVYCTGTFAEQISLTSVDGVSILPYSNGCTITGSSVRDYGILADRTSNLTIGAVEVTGALRNGIKVFVDTASTTDSGVDIAAVVHDIGPGDNTPSSESDLEIGTCILIRTGPNTGTAILDDVDVSEAQTYDCGKHGMDFRWRVTNVRGDNVKAYRNGNTATGHGVSIHPLYTNITSGWTVVSGSVYTRDRLSATDNEQRMVNTTDSVALTKNTGTPTSPGSNEWGVVAAGGGGACTNGASLGCLYLNIGAAPTGKTFALKRHIHGPFNFVALEAYENVETTDGDGEGHGISADDLSGPMTCERCYLHDNEGVGGKTLNGESVQFISSISARNRIGFECTRGAGFDVLNSIASESEDQGIYDGGSICKTMTVKNSIASRNGTSSTANGISLSAGTASTLTETANYAFGNSAAGQCSNATCTNADPRYIGGTSPSTASGFQLLRSSPLIGAGSPLGAKYDYNGIRFSNPPSIGAYSDSAFGFRSTYSFRNE